MNDLKKNLADAHMMVKDITKDHLAALQKARDEGRDMSREEFRSEFCRLTEGFSDLIVAKYLQISRPTVDRWKRGPHAVHLVGRLRIIDSLKKLCRGCGKRSITCFEQSGGDIDPII